MELASGDNGLAKWIVTTLTRYEDNGMWFLLNTQQFSYLTLRIYVQ